MREALKREKGVGLVVRNMDAPGLWARSGARAHCAGMRVAGALRRGARELREDERGQGTTEYAILVGVLVVIAIVAVVAFRGRIQELWDSISSSINGL